LKLTLLFLKKLRPNAYSFQPLIFYYSKKGSEDITAILKLLNDMKEEKLSPTIPMYHAMMDVLIRKNYPDLVLRMYKEMKSSGRKPVVATFALLSKAFHQDQDIMERIREDMRLYNINPLNVSEK
jgi:pentatricopeptide repeat protein